MAQGSSWCKRHSPMGKTETTQGVLQRLQGVVVLSTRDSASGRLKRGRLGHGAQELIKGMGTCARLPLLNPRHVDENDLLHEL